MSRARLIAAARGGARARARAAAPAAARDCPSAGQGADAIVLEASTGDVACERRGRRGAAGRLDREAHDGAGHARARRPRRHLHGRRLPRRARASRRSACAGRADERARPAARAAARAANDAAMTLAIGVAGSSGRSSPDEPARARSSGSRDTHYANPIGLDEPGAHSSARDLAKLALFLRTQAVLPPHGRPAGITLTSGARRARSSTATRSSAPCRGSTASRPATRSAPATCSSGRPPERGSR